jgi:hypothetical protein
LSTVVFVFTAAAAEKNEIDHAGQRRLNLASSAGFWVSEGACEAAEDRLIKGHAHSCKQQHKLLVIPF